MLKRKIVFSPRFMALQCSYIFLGHKSSFQGSSAACSTLENEDWSSDIGAESGWNISFIFCSKSVSKDRKSPERSYFVTSNLLSFLAPTILLSYWGGPVVEVGCPGVDKKHLIGDWRVCCSLAFTPDPLPTAEVRKKWSQIYDLQKIKGEKSGARAWCVLPLRHRCHAPDTPIFILM